jgi:hypothetical protein
MAFRKRWQTNAENHQKIADRDLRTGTLQKLADLRLQNEPQNLWIYDFRTNQQNWCAHLKNAP